jgi:hypothetical protein
MTLQKGWINRQFARVERDVQSWPTWMRREAEMQAVSTQEPSRSMAAGTEAGEPPKSGDDVVQEKRDFR